MSIYRLPTIVFCALIASCIFGLARLDAQPAAPEGVNRLSLDFEDLRDLERISDQFTHLGVSFTGATVLGQGQSLNYLEFPPRSGVNVIYDDPAQRGLITLVFDQNLASNIRVVGAHVTGNRNVTMTAYDSTNNQVASVSTGGANYAPVGTPNMLLEIASNQPIMKVTFFNGGERGNTFTIDDLYFDIGLSCQISNVPPYKQGGAAEWADDPYGGSDIQPWYDNSGKLGTMKDYGCAVTSAAMVVSYQGLLQSRPTTTPRELNNWLRSHKGYSQGAILWPKVAEFARDVKGIQLYYYEGWGPNEGIVNAYVCNSTPIILNTNSSPYTNGHFVVADGILDNSSWSIKDPDDYNLSSLATDAYTGYRKFGTVPKEPKHLTIAIHPPNVLRGANANLDQVHDLDAPFSFTVVDPAGRRTIYEADTNHFENEILDAEFQVETLGERDGSGLTMVTYMFGTGYPLDGEYLIFLESQVSGRYIIDLLGYDADGNASEVSTQVRALPQSSVQFSVTYSSEPGSELELSIEAGVLIPGDCNNDQTVGAADLTALALEFFDGDDNNDPNDTPNGAYPGTPACDANEDGRIGASDLTCIALIFFSGPGACQVGQSAAAHSQPTLVIPDDLVAEAGGQVTVPIVLQGNGAEVSSLLFSIDYDETWLTFDPADHDEDGVPDAIVFNLPDHFVRSVTIDLNDASGELDIMIASFASPAHVLPEGELLSITFGLGSSTDTTEAIIAFAQQPEPSLGDRNGYAISGSAQDGVVRIVATGESGSASVLHLPMISR